MSAPRAASRSVPPLPTAVLDEAGSIFLVSEAFARLVGSSVGHLLGKPFFAEFGASKAIRDAGRAYLAPGGSIDADIEVDAFGATGGSVRIRMCSLDAAAGRFALVVAEEAPEAELPGAARAPTGAEALDAAQSMRHEINNSLMGMFGHLEILLAQPDTPEPVRRRVEIVLRETEKIRDRVAELKTILGN